MAYCFQCGKLLDVSERRLRRRVVTGGSVRFRYPRKTLVQGHTRYGRRVVCKRCARSIDVAQGRDMLIGNLQVCAAVLALVVIALLKWLGVL